MTRKHYSLIVAAIREAKITDLALCEVTYSLADALEKDNPRFDRERFIDAAMSGTEVSA